MNQITTNLAGRKVDIGIFQGVPTTGNVDQKLSMGFGEIGTLVAGVQTVVQSWVLLIMTEKGSVISDADFGTAFMSALRTNQINDDITLQSYFTDAAHEAMAYMTANLEGDELPDEVLTRVELKSYTMFRDKIVLNVALTTAAGITRIVILPTTVPVK